MKLSRDAEKVAKPLAPRAARKSRSGFATRYGYAQALFQHPVRSLDSLPGLSRREAVRSAGVGCACGGRSRRLAAQRNRGDRDDGSGGIGEDTGDIAGG